MKYYYYNYYQRMFPNDKQVISIIHSVFLVFQILLHCFPEGFLSLLGPLLSVKFSFRFLWTFQRQLPFVNFISECNPVRCIYYVNIKNYYLLNKFYWIHNIHILFQTMGCPPPNYDTYHLSTITIISRCLNNKIKMVQPVRFSLEQWRSSLYRPGTFRFLN